MAAETILLEIVTPTGVKLRAQVNDDSGEDGGGDQCCWTTAHVVVNVK